MAAENRSIAGSLGRAENNILTNVCASALTGREAEVLACATEPADGVRFVTRQPILDMKSKVYAYELLFSDGESVRFHGNRESATRTMIDNALLFGLDKLTCGRSAFVKCTSAALTGTLVEVLPAEKTVLEVIVASDRDSSRPSAPPSSLQQLIDACRHLKTAGYRLAFDQSELECGLEPLVELADYIKVDFSRTNREARRTPLRRLKGVKATLVAAKVETQQQLGEARDEGFALVQGFYFCRPSLVASRNVPANWLAQVEILRLLRSDTLNLRKLTQLVKRDASLTYRLLRLVNSPVCAMQQEVHSIQAALLAVGEETFRRLATVAIASKMSAGQPAELLRMAFVRGRFCEVAASLCGLDCTEQYLLGLLSLFGAMLRTPMKEIAAMLPLRDDIRRALEGDHVLERILLDWLERYELGDWAACDTIASACKFDGEDLLSCYQEAVGWAESALYFA